MGEGIPMHDLNAFSKFESRRPSNPKPDLEPRLERNEYREPSNEELGIKIYPGWVRAMIWCSPVLAIGAFAVYAVFKGWL